VEVLLGLTGGEPKEGSTRWSGGSLMAANASAEEEDWLVGYLVKTVVGKDPKLNAATQKEVERKKAKKAAKLKARLEAGGVWEAPGPRGERDDHPGHPERGWLDAPRGLPRRRRQQKRSPAKRMLPPWLQSQRRPPPPVSSSTPRLPPCRRHLLPGSSQSCSLGRECPAPPCRRRWRAGGGRRGGARGHEAGHAAGGAGVPQGHPGGRGSGQGRGRRGGRLRRRQLRLLGGQRLRGPQQPAALQLRGGAPGPGAPPRAGPNVPNQRRMSTSRISMERETPVHGATRSSTPSNNGEVLPSPPASCCSLSPSLFHWCPHPPLCHCVTVSLCHCVTVSLCHRVTVSLYSL